MQPSTYNERKHRYDTSAGQLVYQISGTHPSGQDVSEYGVNLFTCDELSEAMEIAQRINGKIQRKIMLVYTPAGKRFPRHKVIWSNVE